MNTENGAAEDCAARCEPPVPGLQFTTEQGGYKYYVEPATQRQYCQDAVGYWYVYNETSNGFILCSGQPTVGVKVSEETIGAANRRFEVDASGQFKLPRNDDDQVYFPCDEAGSPIFPYDVALKRWTFPVDDTDEPIYPRNEYNKPIVPLDENGEAIFPKDAQGGYIFPMDESHLPTTALTREGRVVAPKDEYGDWVIPRDREGTPMIEISDEGVPMSRQEAANAKLWKKYYKQEQQAYLQYQKQQVSNQPATSASAMFHPLNIEQRNMALGHGIAVLEKAKRIRPEDIDLPSLSLPSSSSAEQTTAVESPPPTTTRTATNGQRALEDGRGVKPAEKGEESGKAAVDKRKAMLSAQLQAAKKAGLTGSSGAPITPITVAPTNPPAVSISFQQQSPRVNSSTPTPVMPSEQDGKSKRRSRFDMRPPESATNATSDAAAETKRDERRSRSPENESHGRHNDSSSPKRRRVTRSDSRDEIRHDERREVGDRHEDERRRGSPTREAPNSNAPQRQQVVNNARNGKERGRNARMNDGNEIIFDIDEVTQSNDISLVRRVIRQEEAKYESTKARLIELGREKKLYKANLVLLYQAEKRIEDASGDMDCDDQDYLSSSGGE